MASEERPIIIPTYKRVWNIPRFLYKIDRFKLFRPVTYWQIMYFFIGIAIAAILNNFFLFAMIPSIIKFLILPFGLAWYLSKAKHDGKAPHRWLATYVIYLLSPKHLNRYKRIRLSSNKKYGGISTFRELYELTDNRET